MKKCVHGFVARRIAGFSQRRSVMFTGLVEEVGELLRLRRDPEGVCLTLTAPKVSQGVLSGDSILVDGACLTVSSHSAERINFHLLDEPSCGRIWATCIRGQKSTWSALACQWASRRTFVQGHVDCTVNLLTAESKGDLKLEFALPANFSHYLVWKGSICVNGVSLTIATLPRARFGVWIIPHTRQGTNLGHLVEGDKVNIEVDLWRKIRADPARQAVIAGITTLSPIHSTKALSRQRFISACRHAQACSRGRIIGRVIRECRGLELTDRFEDIVRTGRVKFSRFRGHFTGQRNFMPAKLKVRTAEAEAFEVEVGNTATIGRSRDNTVSLHTNPHVSRQHAIIRCHNAYQFQIMDLGSRNGTFETVAGSSLPRFSRTAP